MELGVYLVVLAGAALHASWNAIIKLGNDRFASMRLLAIVQAVVGGAILPFVAPPAFAAIGWIVLSASLHVGYKVFLIHSYEHGDFSQVYPLARGSAPFMVAIVSTLILHEPISLLGWAAIVSILGGIALMLFRGGELLKRIETKTFTLALITAFFIASYTLVDGIGARLAGSATSFLFWMMIGDAIGLCLYGVATRRSVSLSFSKPVLRAGLSAGVLSLTAYWTSVWAMTVAPIALVATLRETSILFAMIIAMTFLKEPVTRWRWASAFFIALGMIMMRF